MIQYINILYQVSDSILCEPLVFILRSTSLVIDLHSVKSDINYIFLIFSSKQQVMLYIYELTFFLDIVFRDNLFYLYISFDTVYLTLFLSLCFILQICW